MITLKEWRNGEYHKKPEFQTLEGYYNEVSEFVKKNGKPITRDMIVVRTGSIKEKEEGCLGCSWNPSINNCRRCAKRYNVHTMYWMFVPAGTMAVHIAAGDDCGDFNPFNALEEEYVFDIKGMGLATKEAWEEHKDILGIIAEHKGEYDFLTSDFETQEDADSWELCPASPEIERFYTTKNGRKVLRKLFA